MKNWKSLFAMLKNKQKKTGSPEVCLLQHPLIIAWLLIGLNPWKNKSCIPIEEYPTHWIPSDVTPHPGCQSQWQIIGIPKPKNVMSSWWWLESWVRGVPNSYRNFDFPGWIASRLGCFFPKKLDAKCTASVHANSASHWRRPRESSGTARARALENLRFHKKWKGWKRWIVLFKKSFLAKTLPLTL